MLPPASCPAVAVAVEGMGLLRLGDRRRSVAFWEMGEVGAMVVVVEAGAVGEGR